MADQPHWRELHRTGDPDEAQTLLTTIRAMEFPVRCRGIGAAPRDQPTPSELLDGWPPFVIEVHPDHWVDLHEVLNDLMEEQRAFDQRVAERDAKSERFQRIWTIVAAIILCAVALLAIAIGGCTESNTDQRRTWQPHTV